MLNFFNEYSFFKQLLDFLLTTNRDLNNSILNLSSLIHDYYKQPNDKTLSSIIKLSNKIEDNQKVFTHNKDALLYSYDNPSSKLANKILHNQTRNIINENNIINYNYDKLKFNNQKLFN